MRMIKTISIAVIMLSFAGCGKENNASVDKDDLNAVKCELKRIDPKRYIELDDHSLVKKVVDLDKALGVSDEDGNESAKNIVAESGGKLDEKERRGFVNTLILYDAFQAMRASHVVVTSALNDKNNDVPKESRIGKSDKSHSDDKIVLDFCKYMTSGRGNETVSIEQIEEFRNSEERTARYSAFYDVLTFAGIPDDVARAELAKLVFPMEKLGHNKKNDKIVAAYNYTFAADVPTHKAECLRIRKVLEAGSVPDTRIARYLVSFLAATPEDRGQFEKDCPNFVKMHGIVADFVREIVTEAENANTIFTDGSLDEEILDECKRRRVALEPYSMMGTVVPRETFMEKMTNGSAVAQLGFEHFKRSGESFSSSGFSGALYRHGGMSDSVRERGVEFAEKLAGRILDLWKKGMADTFKDKEMKQKFLAVQWRIARIARLRADQELRAGMVEQSSRSLRTAEELDECNPAVKNIKATWEAKHKSAMDGMSPREQLRLALKKADFESARKPAAILLKGDSNDVDANFALGMWHYQNKRWNDAEKHLLRCRDKKPKEAAVWNNLAMIYMQLGKLDVAIQHARQALALMPSSEEIKDTINQIERATDKTTKNLLNLLACCYAQDGLVEKSREAYQAVLAKDASNHDALMGLWRISLQEGAPDKAKTYLERAIKAPVKEGTVRFDGALLHLMNNSLDEARLALAKITELHPRSIHGWALLAGVMLQQADKAQTDKQKQEVLSEVDNVVLPKMESLAESPRDFFVLMTRALVLMRKGSDKETQKKTRAALERAWMSRPVVSVGAMVLDLDYRLLDRESAERHALQILRQDAGHAFANWVMGSIRMGQGKMKEAETYLRTSVAAPRPLAAAQNDLAEVLRQGGRLVEAEKYARKAKDTDPKLNVVWETLCATLLDQNKNLDEAEQCIQKAIALSEGKDLRMQLTLARVQLAKKDFVKARSTLRSLDVRRDELTNRDRAVLDELQKKAQGR